MEHKSLGTEDSLSRFLEVLGIFLGMMCRYLSEPGAVTPRARNALSSCPTRPLFPQGKQLEVLSSLPEASDRHFVPQTARDTLMTPL